MNNEIKEILDDMKIVAEHKTVGVMGQQLNFKNARILLDYITNLQEELERCVKANVILDDENAELQGKIYDLQEENERLKEQNNDLRKIYKNTYNRLFQNGNDELARYFQAQIDDCPTFYVEPIIDYAKEWKNYKSRNEKAIEHIKQHQLIFENQYEELSGFDNHLLDILNGDDEE